MTKPHEHTFTQIVRMRGPHKVRYRCDTCPKIGPWIKLIHKPDEVPESPVETRPEEPIDPQPEVHFSQYTVPVLKEMAKARGIVGFTKMRKDELVHALQNE